MAYMCDICGKGKQFGKNVPFSMKKTNKVWKPNLQKQRIEIGGSRIQIKACTQCLRTLAKFQRESDKLNPETEAVVAEAKAEAETKEAKTQKAPAKKTAAKKTPAKA